jgi:hypothetical protein
MPTNPKERYRSIFAVNLKALIDRSELSVNAWSKAHKLTQSTINRIVTGEQQPTAKQVEEIAAAAGLDAWRLWMPGYSDAAVAVSPDERPLVLALP